MPSFNKQNFSAVFEDAKKRPRPVLTGRKLAMLRLCLERLERRGLISISGGKP